MLEKSFPDIVDTEPEIVAHHFTEAKLVPQAIDYWEKAATRAIERSTYAEAVGHLKKAIALVADMPPGHAQAIEFRLQMSLGKVYRAAKGSGSVETEAAYRRAHDLSKALSDPEQRLPVLYGLYISTFNQPNLSAARALASEIAETATGMGNRPACDFRPAAPTY